MRDSIKIPEKRIPVLIGKEGKTLQKIENETGVGLNIEDNVIFLTGESLNILVCKNIIQAIGRGFNPQKAFKLLEEKNYLEVINIGDFFSTSKSLKRMKGRIIGRGGKTRKLIEEFTGTFISVYGKTVSIIGDYVSLPIAKKAINILLEGANHKTVYRYLEKNTG